MTSPPMANAGINLERPNMTKTQSKAIKELRAAGWAVILWTPEELGDVKPGWVENCSISYAAEFLLEYTDDDE
jgi:hypothetical protein